MKSMDFGGSENALKAGSLALVLALVMGSMLAILPGMVKKAEAGSVTHDVANVRFRQTDYGRITGEYITWNGVRQTTDIYASIPGFGTIDEESWLGVFDIHDGYDHLTPNIADSFGPGDSADDYTVTGVDTPIFFRENTPSMQESYATYTNTGAGTLDPNDVRITQKTFTGGGNDFAIMEFTVTNIKSIPITGLQLAYHGYISGYYDGIPPMLPPIDAKGPGGDGGDDRDQWYAGQGTYTVEDNNGAGTTMAFSSADPAKGINIFHGEFFDLGTIAAMGTAMPDDYTLLNAIQTAPQQLGNPDCALPTGQKCNIRSIVGWDVDSMFGPLGPGSSIKLPLVIAFGATSVDAMSQVDKARTFYSDLYSKYMLTEIQDEGTPRVEVFNWNMPLVPLGPGGLTISTDMCLSQWTGGSWSAPNLATNTHGFYTLGGADAFPSTEGALLTLCNAGVPVESVGYGQYGYGPDPISGESVALIYYASIGEYGSLWTRGNTPTFGSQNDVPNVNLFPEVVLNEVYFNPTNPADKFVELYYNGTGSVDIAGWDIVADTVYDIPAGPDAVLSTTNRYYHLREFEDPAFFAALTVSGDNVYLFDAGATPVLQDMGGWTSAHGADLSMTRLPDGAGTFDGYDDVSSTAAGWVFNSVPTYSIVLIWNDQEQWGDPGHFVWYTLNVTNKQGAADCIDITYQAGPNGWSMEFFEADRVTPLVDKEPASGCPTADGVPDTGPLASGDTYKISVKVNLDATPMFGIDKSMVFAQASLDPLGRDLATLTTYVNPWIQPDAKVESPPHPTTIYEKSAGALGYVNETQVTLNATGVGFLQYTGQDVVFILDSSGSMSWNDPDPDGIPCNPVIPNRVDASWEYADNLTGTDRGAYVDFDAGASLRVPLVLGTGADSYNYLKQAPFNGLWCSDQDGGTLFSPAITEANNELIANGDPQHVKVEILLTDGESSMPIQDYPNGLSLAQEAADNDIIIFTIGLTVIDPTALQFLRDVADITGGQFFPAPTASALSSIFKQIMDLVRNVAGYNPTPGSASMMIEFVLDQGIEYIDGTFELVPGTIEVDPVPDSITFNPMNTTLEWNWTGDQMRVIEYWAVRFNVSSTRLGVVPVNIVPDSSISYMTSNGIMMTREFPLVMITVLTPSLQPLITDLTVDPGGVNIGFTEVLTAEYYEIYGGPTQTSIDLATVLATVNAPQTSWVDTSRPAQDPDEYYYVVRAVDSGTIPPTKSMTSNTGGYFRVQLDPGTNSISTPLKPLSTITLDSVMADVGADSLSILDASNDWQTYASGPPGAVVLGDGYVLEMPPGPSVPYWFTGEPSSMVMYEEGFGFDNATRDDLAASVNPSGDVALTWSVIPNAEYYVYWSDRRDGFFRGTYTVLNGGNRVALPTFVHTGAVGGAGENFYMIIPYDTGTGNNGSSSYSIGVITEEYNGNELFGLPLKPLWGAMSADWYADRIPSCLGIVFLDNGEWKAHFKEFPEGVYDTHLEVGNGYVVSVYSTSLFSYVGR